MTTQWLSVPRGASTQPTPFDLAGQVDGSHFSGLNVVVFPALIRDAKVSRVFFMRLTVVTDSKVRQKVRPIVEFRTLMSGGRCSRAKDSSTSSLISGTP